VLYFGVKRDWGKSDSKAGTKFGRAS